MKKENKLDYDYIIIGSGFGGSVSALRLAEKGYTVLVIERGKRYQTGEFGESIKDAHKISWVPKMGMYGIQQTSIFKHVLILSGSGVGGGSLTYANTHLQPEDKVLENPAWRHLEDWKKNLKPKYELARMMLGTVESPKLFRSDELLLEAAKELNPDVRIEKVGVGIYFGDAVKTTPDPYFGGKGPDRKGCDFCGSCMSGCNQGAKNTLDKNYLYLAEKLGVDIIPEHEVTMVSPLNGDDGASGYRVEAAKITGFKRLQKSFTAKGVVCSAGVLGTLALLHKMKSKNILPNISPRLGTSVRTNSESLVFAAYTKDPDPDLCKGFSISGMIKLDAHSTTEIVRMGKGMDVMGLMTTQLTNDIPPLPRWIVWIFAVLTHPLALIRRFNPVGWGERSFCTGIMQDLDNTLNIEYKRKFPFFTKKLVTREADKPMPKAFIPEAHFLAKTVSKKIEARPQSFIPDALLNKSTTAHILGGCPMGKDKDEGVVDKHGNVFGYQNLKVIDASIIPVNLAVNPSLTITALAEYAMDGGVRKKYA